MRLWALLVYATFALPVRAAGPRLAISLNESSAAVIFPGWPVVAQVSIGNDGGGGDLRLASTRGAWPLAIRFVVTGPSAKPEDWKFELTAQPPGGATTLPPRSRTTVFLVLDAEKTAGLTVGVYSLAAELEIGGSDGWNGLVRSPAASVEIRKSAAPTADQETEMTLLRAGVRLLRKQNADAKRILGDYLGANPKAVPALRMMAELLEDEGDFVRAYLYAAAAVKSYQADTGRRSERPGQLLLLRDRLWRKTLDKAK